MPRHKIFDILAMARLMNQIIKPAIKFEDPLFEGTLPSDETLSQVATHRHSLQVSIAIGKGYISDKF